jgi:hypothetical protein
LGWAFERSGAAFDTDEKIKDGLDSFEVIFAVSLLDTVQFILHPHAVRMLEIVQPVAVPLQVSQ